MGWLKPGVAIRVMGLRGSPELNGAEGTCRQFDPTSGRWVVRLRNGEEKALRSCNLEEVQPLHSTKPGAAGVATAASTAAVGGVDRSAEPEVIMELKTPGVEAAEAGFKAVDSPDEIIERLVSDMLFRLDLEGLPVQNSGGGVWMFGGQRVRLHYSDSGGRSPPRVLASLDDGQTWEMFEDLCQRLAVAASGPAHGRPGAFSHQAQQQQPQQFSSSSTFRPQGFATTEPNYDGPVRRGGFGDDDCSDSTAQMPAYRSDGLPTFNQAFPPQFDAHSGPSHYYNQFRVRVPTSSQYDSEG